MVAVQNHIKSFCLLYGRALFGVEQDPLFPKGGIFLVPSQAEVAKAGIQQKIFGFIIAVVHLDSLLNRGSERLYLP
jgi:hypothetical protein